MTLAETTKNLLEIGVLAFGLLAAIRPIRESHLVEQLAPQHFVVIGSVKTITRKDQPGYKAVVQSLPVMDKLLALSLGPATRTLIC
jgi:hypothetical protein